MGMRAFRLVSFAVVIASFAASCGDNLTPEPDPDEVVTVRLDTMAPTQVAAGDTIGVACTLYENDITTMVPAEVRVVAEDKVIRMGGNVVARKVGMIEVSCALPARGIVDVTPAIVEIVAGPAANVATTVTPNPVVAGNDVTATCEVYDGYGNLIADPVTMPTLELSPIDAANTVTDLTATMIRSGHYTGTCKLPGTNSNNAPFDVVPNLPASIVLQKAPDFPVYAINDNVQILHVVYDRYSNEIPTATVTDFSTPLTGVGPTTSAGNSTYRYGGEGSYRITVTVDPPTDLNATVSATIDVFVNSRGPAIVCANDATMLNLNPGSTMTVTGSANDVNGVASITVNGNNVTIGPNGTFSAPITTRFGMNFVDVTATDTFGEPTVKVCTFLISNHYASLTSPIADTVSLKLTQPAVDDNDRNDLDSFADLLHTVVNSQGLRDSVHTALAAANPLKPSACDSQTCTFLGCVCWYSSQVRYLSSQFDGPHTVSLSLVNGGIAAVARFDNVHIQLRVDGKVGPIPYDTSGWVDVSYLQIQLTLDTALSNGRPHITVRPGSVSAQVGSISTNFGGLDGWIINNIVVPLAQGSLRDALRNVIQNFVVNNFNAVLDGLVSGLDISTLGTTFNVPKLGGGTMPMQFGLAFSSLDATAARLLFGIGTRFTTTAANAYPSLGVALPPGATLLDPSVGAPNNTGVGVHVGVVNGALHALWRGNFFAMALAGSQLGGNLPAGVTLDVTTRLPPVAFISNTNIVQLHLGAVDLTIQHPDLPPSIGVRLGAEAHASVTLVGNDLKFGGIVIDSVHASSDAVNLTVQAQQSLQTVLVQVAQALVDQSLNNSLPSLPIPSFTLPGSLAQFGLPAGRQLGINSPTLSIAPQHFTLRGQFGLLP